MIYSSTSYWKTLVGTIIFSFLQLPIYWFSLIHSDGPIMHSLYCILIEIQNQSCHLHATLPSYVLTLISNHPPSTLLISFCVVILVYNYISSCIINSSISMSYTKWCSSRDQRLGVFLLASVPTQTLDKYLSN